MSEDAKRVKTVFDHLLEQVVLGSDQAFRALVPGEIRRAKKSQGQKATAAHGPPVFHKGDRTRN